MSKSSRIHPEANAQGAEAAMARLLGWLIGRAHELEREYLAVPLEHLPALAARMEELSPELDTRAFRWGVRELPIMRPYTDLPLLAGVTHRRPAKR